MIDFLHYPYAIGSVLLLLILTGFSLIWAQWRETALISALLSMPSSFSTVLFVPEYWMPVRLFDYWIGIEDVVFSFATGGIVWFIAVASGRLHPPPVAWQVVAWRYLLIVVLGCSVNVTMQIIGGPIMVQAVGGMLVIACILSWRSWRALIPALRCGVLFTFLYFLLLDALFWFVADFDAQWSIANLSGVRLLNVYVEEITWAFGFAVTWTLIMFFVFDMMAEPAER